MMGGARHWVRPDDDGYIVPCTAWDERRVGFIERTLLEPDGTMLIRVATHGEAQVLPMPVRPVTWGPPPLAEG